MAACSAPGSKSTRYRSFSRSATARRMGRDSSGVAGGRDRVRSKRVKRRFQALQGAHPLRNAFTHQPDLAGLEIGLEELGHVLVAGLAAAYLSQQGRVLQEQNAAAGGQLPADALHPALPFADVLLPGDDLQRRGGPDPLALQRRHLGVPAVGRRLSRSRTWLRALSGSEPYTAQPDSPGTARVKNPFSCSRANSRKVSRTRLPPI